MTGTLLQRQARALADVEGAPVNLRELKLAHPFSSWDVIRGMITRHYSRQLLQEIYKVLGSADVFGNPVGFIRSMASGMWEFISAPTRSSVQSPTEFVREVAQGTQSLFTNTVFAFSNAATRISKAARKSLTGLLQAPIRGAERDGLPGMLSGMALGAVGVIARPVASILEVAGMTAESIRNRSRPAQWHATRVRIPRHVTEDCPLLFYSWERAVGQAVLLEAEGGRYNNEVYFTCRALAEEGKFLLLTETKILKVGASADAACEEYSSRWKVEHECAIDDVLRIDQTDAGISVLLGPPTRPLTKPASGHHQQRGGRSSKYIARFTPFAHETFQLLTANAADEFLKMVRLLEDRRRCARSKLLLASTPIVMSGGTPSDLDSIF